MPTVPRTPAMATLFPAPDFTDRTAAYDRLCTAADKLIDAARRLYGQDAVDAVADYVAALASTGGGR